MLNCRALWSPRLDWINFKIHEGISELVHLWSLLVRAGTPLLLFFVWHEWRLVYLLSCQLGAGMPFVENLLAGTPFVTSYLTWLKAGISFVTSIGSWYAFYWRVVHHMSDVIGGWYTFCHTSSWYDWWFGWNWCACFKIRVYIFTESQSGLLLHLLVEFGWKMMSLLALLLLLFWSPP